MEWIARVNWYIWQADPFFINCLTKILHATSILIIYFNAKLSGMESLSIYHLLIS